jgi:hypothetical protein
MSSLSRIGTNHLRETQRGSTLVELSLCLPLLLGLFLGTWQFGYAYYLYAGLEQAVRAGGRYASLASYDAAHPSDYSDAVKNTVVFGGPDADGAQPVVPGLATTMVSVDLTITNGIPTAVSVSIRGYSLPGIFGSITLQGKPNIQFPFLGNWAPA